MFFARTGPAYACWEENGDKALAERSRWFTRHRLLFQACLLQHR